MADKKDGKKGKKFPMRSMITSNMRLRYSLGERENTESSKPAHSMFSFFKKWLTLWFLSLRMAEYL